MAASAPAKALFLLCLLASLYLASYSNSAEVIADESPTTVKTSGTTKENDDLPVTIVIETRDNNNLDPFTAKPLEEARGEPEPKPDTTPEKRPASETTTTGVATQITATDSDASKSAAETTTTTTVTPPTTTIEQDPNQDEEQPEECGPEIYCFHGGTCIINEKGQKECICPPEYSGLRCQDRNICETVIADSLTGVQICAKINSDCIKDDKIFRCACQPDESFIFKLNHNQPKGPTTSGNMEAMGGGGNNGDNGIQSQHRSSSGNNGEFNGNNYLDLISPNSNQFVYDPSSRLDHRVSSDKQDSLDKQDSNQKHQQQHHHQQQFQEQTYLAECRKIDKCLGVRCKQMSEVCNQGECQCNLNLGYMRDPVDNRCKLINPCKLPTPPGQPPICGEARCVATLDSELYRCVCPIGYDAISSQGSRSQTKCVLMYDSVCRIPLLNKCQHICRIDASKNTYRCSCLPGYKPGQRVGIDDHMCFFNERFENLHESYLDSSSEAPEVADSFDSLYPRYPPGQLALSPLSDQYEFQVFPRRTIDKRDIESTLMNAHINNREATIPYDYDVVDSADSSSYKSDTAATGSPLPVENEARDTEDPRKPKEPKRVSHIKEDGYLIKRVLRTKDKTGRQADPMDGEFDATIGLSAQDRCNMYCEENKICVLENGSTDSYKCICDRQGYVSVGDRCLDWCTAAVFQDNLIHGLNLVCYSGACIKSSSQPGTSKEAKQSVEIERLERMSSWRPQFECNCSASRQSRLLLTQDPETKLCKLNFGALIDPCLPGNEGYIDCVENKNAYCAVQHEHPDLFHASLRAPRTPTDGVGGAGATASGQVGVGGAAGPMGMVNSASGTSKSKINKPNLDKKPYVCVCSLEKKFLVDQPRQKAICVDECDLLNNECGRFNRMCRAATIDIDDYGKRNLVQLYRGEPRMNFKRTGCECLPGFNVGPTELVYVTLDDNNRLGEQNFNKINANPSYTLPSSQSPDGAGEFDDEGASGVKYININSRCLLDYDVVEFNATFKAPADFDPRWVKIRNAAAESPAKVPDGSSSSSLTSKQVTGSKLKKTNSSKEATGVRGPSGWSAADEQSSGKDKRDVVKVIKGDPLLEDPRADRPQTSPPSSSSSPPPPSSPIDEQKGTKGHEMDYIIPTPSYMMADISELHKNLVFIGYCDPFFATISLEAYQECVMYRYWIVRKLRNHFADWRQVMTAHLSKTFELMDGNIRFRVNKCEANIKSITRIEGDDEKTITSKTAASTASSSSNSDSDSDSDLDSNNSNNNNELITFDPMDPYTQLDADLDCELTVHAARDLSKPHYLRQVLLERQLPRFIYTDHQTKGRNFGSDYYLMAPEILLQRGTYDNFFYHHGEFRPCERDYAYCDKETKCTMKDQVNFTCTCLYGYTPIGSRDLFLGDSRKEVCEDINECLFDVCKKLENVSTCVNEIGDYKCLCNRHYMGDNKEFCHHVCNTIPCKHGKCRLVADHYAFCECDEGYKESDCSVQDPSAALRKANMIICGSIFTSALLLAITWAISLNSQLKKTKKKLKRLEAANDAANLFDLSHHHHHGQQPYRPRMSKASVCS